MRIATAAGPLARTAFFLAFSLAGAALLLALLESVLALALWTPPGWGPASFEEARRRYHVHHERHIVQYLPACAEHDAELGYRLRPGVCRFANREFDTELRIHALGARGDASALVAPRLVVVGDSFAMGWGVAQSERVSAGLERLLDEPVLDLAVSSYGTAREMLMLQRADLSAADTLVIQYCENDYAENVAFANNRGALRVATREQYEARTREHAATTRYVPGKLLRHLFPLLWQGWRGWPLDDPPRPCARDADAFLAVLQWIRPLPRALRVVVLEGLYGAKHRSCFLEALEARAPEIGLPRWVGSLETLDVATFLDAGDYHPLDGHWNASGHRKVAAALAERLAHPPAP